MDLPKLQLHLLWLYLTTGIFIYGVFVIFLPNFIPATLSSIYKYGKSAEKSQISLISDLVSVPKRWFLHFYVCACTFHVFLLYSVFTVYFQGQSCPAILQETLKLLAPSWKYSTVSSESVAIALVLMVAQVFRRLYECLFVSVYSDAKMSLLHYFFGLYFYPAVGMSIIMEAPGFFTSGPVRIHNSHFLTTNHVIGSILFIVGWCIEYNSHCILANLRKNSKGEITNSRYTIPSGGLFTWVSCPHYFGEVIMYLAVLVIFGGRNWTWWCVFLNVLTNQVMAALMSHQWYKDKFKEYPAQRKALIPFIL